MLLQRRKEKAILTAVINVYLLLQSPKDTEDQFGAPELSRAIILHGKSWYMDLNHETISPSPSISSPCLSVHYH